MKRQSLKKVKLSQKETTKYLNILNSGVLLNINELERVAKRLQKDFIKKLFGKNIM